MLRQPKPRWLKVDTPLRDRTGGGTRAPHSVVRLHCESEALPMRASRLCAASTAVRFPEPAAPDRIYLAQCKSTEFTPGHTPFLCITNVRACRRRRRLCAASCVAALPRRSIWTAKCLALLDITPPPAAQSSSVTGSNWCLAPSPGWHSHSGTKSSLRHNCRRLTGRRWPLLNLIRDHQMLRDRLAIC